MRSSAVALLDSFFEHPARVFFCGAAWENHRNSHVATEFPRSLLAHIKSIYRIFLPPGLCPAGPGYWSETSRLLKTIMKIQLKSSIGKFDMTRECSRRLLKKAGLPFPAILGTPRLTSSPA